MTTTKIRITVPEELRDALLEHVDKNDTTITKYVNSLLTDALSGQEKNDGQYNKTQ